MLTVCDPDGSDTASFDEVLELLHLGGRTLPHAVMMMIPEAWENNTDMEADRRAFYEFHSSVMEPWDGPACVTFSDGNQIGAVLDRNGLRPGRFWVTEDGLVVLASEAGVLDIDQSTITRKGRLEPGKMFLLDLDQHRIIEDHEITNTLAGEIYWREYGWDARFEALVADIAARFVRKFQPAWERCWIAELDGERVGAVFVVRKSPTTAQLRMLILSPSARGLGLGGRLTAECLTFARAKGYRKMELWTNSCLVAARAIYAKRGFRLVKSEPYEGFGQSLVGETWSLKL